MGRPSAVMASASTAQQPPPSVSRSHSSPDLFSLPSLDNPTVSTHPSHLEGLIDHRDWTGLPAFEVPSFNSDFDLDTPVLSNGRILQPADPPAPGSAPHKEETWERLSRKPSLARSKTTSLINRPRSWLLSSARSTRDITSEERHSRPLPSVVDYGADPALAEDPESDRSLPASVSFATFAKWSWMASSRSPSPKTLPESTATKPPAGASATPPHGKRGPPERLQLIADADTSQTHGADSSSKQMPRSFSTRSSSYLPKRMRKSSSVRMTRITDGLDSDNSCASSSTSLGNRASNSDKTSASLSTCSDGNTNTPITDESSNEMPPPLRDPLWSSFKTLEVDFKGFASKQTAQRIGQIKKLVVPFLRSTMDNKSVKRLSLADVERRATILNKWWVALLETLNDQAQHPVPGVDRPALLEAATLLMMRPEWRQATTYFQPLADRSPTERVRGRSWTNASTSTGDSSNQSALLAESTEHNVRNMFVTNLVKQMSYVVDKMSVRHAPLSLVNFAGKTCAYAFFFAPGVADILIRLWGLTPELIRRTADDFGLPRRDSGESDDIVALFPPKLGVFGWTSARAMWDMLKRIPHMSLLVARIAWTGPWVSRWKGRDTDLFFIFCKYFHVLSDQFMPPGLPMTEKARSPAFVLVHAQLLTIFDTTIHRQTAMEHAYGPPLIDSITGTGASALALPLPTNLMKGMSENRLVILLRDFLSDDAAEMASARHTFAEAFACLMKAATCRTSQFNSAACFTLCDFLEEAITIYHEFESRDMPSNYVDWNLWLEVCKRIMSSLNTMSEVRMLSFLYSIWDVVAKDGRWKAALCLDWLLTEETFDSLFNNWCPMVRAYYQRLLCWRMCRDDGHASEVDLKIMLVASTRLKTVWSHYLYMKKSAEESARAPPSTVPMCPTLGRKFMIVRQEANTVQPGLFMGFDTFARISPNDGLSGNGLADNAALVAKGDSKKRWSLLGKVLSMTTGSGNVGQAPAQDGPGRKPFADGEALGTWRGVPELSLPPVAPPSLSSAAGHSSKAARADSDALSSSPVFEDRKYTFKFILGWHQQPMSPLGRDLRRPQLPALAQLQVTAKAEDAGPAASLCNPRPLGRRDHGNGGGYDESSHTDQRSSVKASVEEWLRGTPVAAAELDKTSPGTSEGHRSPGAERRHTSAKSQVQQKLDTARETLMEAVKPVGIYTKNAVYSGRALAEWAQVVSECNNFAERRREEGVEGAGEVEVPQLGVEGFRKLGG